MRVGWLFVERHRVVHGGGDAGGVQPDLKRVAVLDQNAVLSEDACAVCFRPRQQPTKTFWPKEQRSPMRAPEQMWTQCQMREPSPIWAPSSTMAVGWIVMVICRLYV